LSKYNRWPLLSETGEDAILTSAHLALGTWHLAQDNIGS